MATLPYYLVAESIRQLGGPSDSRAMREFVMHVTSRVKLRPFALAALMVIGAAIAITPTAPASAAPVVDIDVGLTATSAPLSSQITYTLTITNHGPDDSPVGIVEVLLPSQTTAVNLANADCPLYDSGTKRLLCGNEAIPSGESRTHTIVASFGVLALGPLNATAALASPLNLDTNAANNTSTANCTAVTGLVILC